MKIRHARNIMALGQNLAKFFFFTEILYSLIHTWQYKDFVPIRSNSVRNSHFLTAKRHRMKKRALPA